MAKTFFWLYDTRAASNWRIRNDTGNKPRVKLFKDFTDKAVTKEAW